MRTQKYQHMLTSTALITTTPNHCPHLHGHTHPRESKQEEDLCPTLCQIVGVRHGDGALSLLGPVGYFDRVKRVSDTAFVYIMNLSGTLADATIVEADKMSQSLQTHMHPNMSETTVQALQRLEDVFQEAAKENKFAHIRLTSAPPPEQLL